MTVNDKTPMIFEQRTRDGCLHVYVVPRYVALQMKEAYPHAGVELVDKTLHSAAAALIELEDE